MTPHARRTLRSALTASKLAYEATLRAHYSHIDPARVGTLQLALEDAIDALAFTIRNDNEEGATP